MNGQRWKEKAKDKQNDVLFEGIQREKIIKNE